MTRSGYLKVKNRLMVRKFITMPLIAESALMTAKIKYTLKVSLRNSKNALTVTDGVEYQKITVDVTSPTADFKDLGNAGQFNKVLPNDWKGFGNVSKDKIKEYLVTSDDATSKVKSLKTCKITVDNDDAEAIVDKISEAVKNDSVWEEKIVYSSIRKETILYLHL